MFRGCRVAAYAGGPLALALYRFGGSSYVHGILFTTLARRAGSSHASAPTILADSFAWVGIVFVLAVLGTVVSFFASPGRLPWFCVVFTVAVVLAPLHQAQIHTTTSLHKHVIFGAWFGAIVAGYLLDLAGKVHPTQGWRVGAVAAGLGLFIGSPQATSSFVYGWPNVTQMDADLSRIIPSAGCPCLIAEQNPLRYYLPKLASERIVGPYSFWYWQASKHRVLTGVPAYEQAISNHYFSVVEMDPAENVAIYEPVIRTLEATRGYRREVTIKIDDWGRQTMQIWRFVGTGRH